MPRQGQGLGQEVDVDDAGDVEDLVELPLTHEIIYLVKSHVERFRPARRDGVVRKTHSVTEVGKNFAFVVCNPSRGVNAGVFGFGDDRADDGK